MREMIALIDYAAKRKDYTPKQMAIFTEMGLSTWFHRKKCPEEFRLAELQEISKKLDIDFVIHSGDVVAKMV